MRKLMFMMLAMLLLCSCGGVRHYTLEVVAEYPHDVTSYTQGLFFRDGQLYESTGQYGESTFRKVDLKSGEAIERINFDPKYFLEGSVMLDGKLYILTWREATAFVYDADSLKYLQGWSYPREGWGITTDGKQLIASDGSSRLYFMDENFQELRHVTVRNDGRMVRWLNELEYIDGQVWANVYTTDEIVMINPEDGKVTGVIDCTGLLPRGLYTDRTDVLNGIAYDEKTGKIFLTGKYWPRMYEVRLVRVK
ncbi:MAG: glutaminyl-peptide cyclotransferase [Bacteroidales bacterium]|nr:glutaminyl-peptide cyclotransferase [Bacteroidales bacterium]